MSFQLLNRHSNKETVSQLFTSFSTRYTPDYNVFAITYTCAKHGFTNAEQAQYLKHIVNEFIKITKFHTIVIKELMPRSKMPHYHGLVACPKESNHNVEFATNYPYMHKLKPITDLPKWIEYCTKTWTPTPAKRIVRKAKKELKKEQHADWEHNCEFNKHASCVCKLIKKESEPIVNTKSGDSKQPKSIKITQTKTVIKFN